MKNKHTPAPWKVVRTYTGHYDVLRTDERYKDYIDISLYICKCLGSKEITKANAKLIAAAPELLEALQELTQSFGLTKTVIVSKIQQAAFDKSIAAIKKATE